MMNEGKYDMWGLYSDSPGECGKGAIWYTESSSYDPAGFEKQVLAVASTPGWRRIANSGGVLPVNPYHSIVHTRQRSGASGLAVQPGYYCSEKNKAIFTDWYDLHASEALPASWKDLIPPPPSSAIDNAVNTAIAQASSSMVQAPLTVIEARETYHMVVNCFGRFLRWVDNVYFHGGRRDLSRDWDPASLWLEYRYGWRPFIAEVQGYMDAYDDVVNVGMRKHGTGMMPGTPFTKSETTNHDNGVYVTSTTKSLEVTSSVRGFALAGVNAPFAAKWGTNILTTGWEALTLSFVIDWFLDVGSFLAANSVGSSGYELLSSGATIRQEIRYTVSRSRTYYGSGWSGGYSGMSCVSTSTETIRTPHSGGFPMPTFSLNPLQITDMLALLRQFYAGLERTYT